MLADAATRIAVVLLVSLAICVSARGDETLAGLRADVRTPSEYDDSSDSDDRDRRDEPSDPASYDDEYYDEDAEGEYGEEEADDEFEDSLLTLAALAVTSPFWGPPAMMGDDYSRPGYFSCHPHAYDVGYMLIDPPEAVGMPGDREPHVWAARVRGEFGTGFDDLDWIGGHVLIDTTSRLGLDSDVRYVWEDLDARRDSLWLGDANVLFRFAQSEFLQFHTGLGMNYLSDTVGSDFGFNFTHGLDFEPVRPWVFSAELDLGTLGHASVVHVRMTAGAMWGASEAFIGYDLYDVGSTQIQGLVAGVRLWF